MVGTRTPRRSKLKKKGSGPTMPSGLGTPTLGCLFVYSATLIQGYLQRTIFDSIRDEGRDFAVYAASLPTTLFYRNLRKLKYMFKFHLFSTFAKHAARGDLKTLSSCVGPGREENHRLNTANSLGELVHRDWSTEIRPSPLSSLAEL